MGKRVIVNFLIKGPKEVKFLNNLSHMFGNCTHTSCIFFFITMLDSPSIQTRMTLSVIKAAEERNEIKIVHMIVLPFFLFFLKFNLQYVCLVILFRYLTFVQMDEIESIMSTRAHGFHSNLSHSWRRSHIVFL